MADDRSSSWSVQRAVADMVDAGTFGPEGRFVSFEPDVPPSPMDSRTLVYGNVTVVADAGSEQDLLVSCVRPLVVKLKHRDAGLRDAIRADLQFRNEMLFYERIAPFMMSCVLPLAGGGVGGDGDGGGGGDDVDDAPPDRRIPPLFRYLYGRNDEGDFTLHDVLVLENAAVSGYRPASSDHMPYLDFDHLVAAIRTLARFHGLSYRAKYVNMTMWMDVIGRVEETQWDTDGGWIMDDDVLSGLLVVAVDGLDETDGDERMGRFRSEFLEDARDALRRATEPAEPLAVLCHGHFDQDRLLFRYDKRGRPVEALPLDAATVRYGSPALDLSFLLYANANHQTREQHWGVLLDEYCAALSAALSDVNVCVSNIPMLDRRLLDAEIRDRAFYGLAHASYFVRLTSADQEPVDVPRLTGEDGDQLLGSLLSYGGRTATDAVADAVRHFVDMRYGDGGDDASS